MFTLPAFRYWLPNLFTFASAFTGVLIIFLSARATAPTDYYFAALLIPMACVLDGFDGRVARWTHGESAMGVQLDSMSDLTTFGVAPAFLSYYWALESFGFGGLVLCFVFVAGAMLRLARFNVQAEDDHGVSRYFSGLPVPMAAMGIATLVCLDTRILLHGSLSTSARGGIGVAVVLLALLMVSNVPFRTFKDMRRSPGSLAFVSTILVLLVVLTYRFDVLSALGAIFAGYFFGNLIVALLTRGWRDTALTTAPALEDEAYAERVIEDELKPGA